MDARAEPESAAPLALALAAGNRRIRCSYEYESPSSRAFPDTPSFDSISDTLVTPVFDNLESDQSLGRQQPGSIDIICSVSSAECGAPTGYPSGSVVRPRRNATPTEWCETFRRWSEGPKRSTLQPSTHMQKSVGRYCCACTSVNVRHAFGRLCTRVYSQTTRQRSTLLQATCEPTAISTNNRRASPSVGILVPTHLQAECRTPLANAKPLCQVLQQFSPKLLSRSWKDTRGKPCSRSWTSQDISQTRATAQEVR